MPRPHLLSLLLAVCGTSACGPADLAPGDLRPDLGYLGAKADERPGWLRATGVALGCGESARGTFVDVDSAHLFSLEVSPGSAVRLDFTGWYAPERGAAVAAYHADSGELLRLLRNPWDSRVTLDFVAPDGEQLVVAAYALTWEASGAYELQARCTPHAR